MDRHLSEKLVCDVRSAVAEAIAQKDIVNVPVLAETVRLRNLAENVALEDIEYQVMAVAMAFGAAMAFARPLLTTAAFEAPVALAAPTALHRCNGGG